MLRNLIFLAVLFCSITGSVLATTPDMGGFDYVFYTPVGHFYEPRPTPPRAPIWTANRWEGAYAPLWINQVPNSPANGTDTQFPLVLDFADNGHVYHYPILYVNEEKLHIYSFAVGVSEIDHSHWSVEQGTGVLTLDEAPHELTQIYFEITN